MVEIWHAATLRVWYADEWIWAALGLFFVVINVALMYGAVIFWQRGELTVGEFVAVIWTGTVYLLQSQTLGQLATLNIGQWLKNDGSGNLTIKNGANLGDDGSGNLEVIPGFLPPTGSILPYAGTTAPTGFALCYGTALSRTTFAALFAVCGIAYGAGDGVTTFNVPDLRGRVAASMAAGHRLPCPVKTMRSPASAGFQHMAQVPHVAVRSKLCGHIRPSGCLGPSGCRHIVVT